MFEFSTRVARKSCVSLILRLYKARATLVSSRRKPRISSSLKSNSSGDVAETWTLHKSSPIGNLEEGAQLASFSWGNNATTGDPIFRRILASGSDGVVAYELGSSWPDTWQSTTIDVMKNVQSYSALAANVDRHVYALQDGTVKEYTTSSDRLTWTLIGEVPTEN